MKIVCDNCATKYQIADEKVSGKAFKIRCKKCGHVIVVNKGPGEAGAGQAPAPEASVNQEPSAPAAEAAPPSDAVWHLVIDREQVGPMTPDEVRTKVRSGQVDSETYGWREGFDDWLKLSAIEDFKSLFAGGGGDDQATRRSSAGDRDSSAGAGSPPGADLFGGINEPIKTAAPGAATIVSDGMHAPDLAALGLTPAHTSAPAAAPTMMAAPEAAPTQMVAPRSAPVAQAQSDGGGGGMDAPVKSMAGARSENSVLFSLNNLSALAGGGGGGGGGGGSASANKSQGADKPGYANAQSEASGLIDIRAMAAATLGSQSVGGGGPMSRGPDLLGSNDAAPVFTPLAPAILMPTAESSGVPKWVFALVGLGVLMFVGMIVTLVVVLRDPTPGPVATGGPAKDTPTNSGTGTTIVTTPPEKTPAGSGTTAAPPTKESPGTKPSGEGSGTKPSGSSEKKPKETKSSDSGSKKEPKHEAKPEKSPEPPAPKNDPPPPPKKEKPAKAKDDLDSLLDGASGGSGGKPVKVEKEDLPEQLSMSAVQSTLKGVNVSSCKGEGASGVVNVKLTIGKDGKVSNASPQGGAAGGDCVAGKVKSAKFPRFSGDPMTLTFPFIVR